MKKYARQAGFSAVELLITLFVAAGFLLAAYQLYNIVIKDGGAAHQQAVASNIAYDYLRQYEATAPNPCSASTPVDTTESAEGVGEMQITVNYTCPVASDLSVTKVEVEVIYGGDASVSYATYTRGIDEE